MLLLILLVASALTTCDAALNAAQTKDLLDTHNKMRRDVAKGLVRNAKGQMEPAAANMQMMAAKWCRLKRESTNCGV